MKQIIVFLALFLAVSCTKNNTVIVENVPAPYSSVSWESQIQPGWWLQLQSNGQHYAFVTQSSPVEVTTNDDGTYSYEVTFNLSMLDTNPANLQVLTFNVLNANGYKTISDTLVNVSANGTGLATCIYSHVTYLPTVEQVGNSATVTFSFTWQ